MLTFKQWDAAEWYAFTIIRATPSTNEENPYERPSDLWLNLQIRVGLASEREREEPHVFVDDQSFRRYRTTRFVTSSTDVPIDR